MAAAECQSRQLAEVIATLDGAYLTELAEPCREEPAYEVHVEHQLGLRAALCEPHQLAVAATTSSRSVRLRST